MPAHLGTRAVADAVLHLVQEPADMLNKAIEDKEGCNIWGWLDVQRVAGNFHLGVHASSYFMLKSVSRCLCSLSSPWLQR